MKRFWKNGDPWIWLTGGALAISLVMVVLLVALVLWNGFGFFWAKDLIRWKLVDGAVVLGEQVDREIIPQPDAPEGTAPRHRILVKRGNRESFRTDFLWIDEDRIVESANPLEASRIERLKDGNYYGTLLAVIDGSKVLAQDSATIPNVIAAQMVKTRETLDAIDSVKKDTIGEINAHQEEIRLELKGLETRGLKNSSDWIRLQAENAQWQERYEAEVAKLRELRESLTAELVVVDSAGKEKAIPFSQIVRVVFPNKMGALGKLGFYIEKLWEFVSDDPRESNTEGGVFPAIFGTVMMVLLMSIIVTPLGVLAAFYLREYAKQGTFVSAVRIAVNNLAGVPSIVFGVFGVGFFIYFVGGTIDKFFYSEALPTPTFGTGGILWASLTLALLTVPVVIVATEEGLAAIPRGMREASLALGATKFETTWKVVLPAVMPSILTGLILAMARAAGEVAPLMITGVVKFAPTLPIDGDFPFIHFERKFMHLGFNIYDVGFQSPNVDAARPMVFATTLLLLAIVLFLNLGAIALRNRLRKKFALSAL